MTGGGRGELRREKGGAAPAAGHHGGLKRLRAANALSQVRARVKRRAGGRGGLVKGRARGGLVKGRARGGRQGRSLKGKAVSCSFRSFCHRRWARWPLHAKCQSQALCNFGPRAAGREETLAEKVC